MGYLIQDNYVTPLLEAQQPDATLLPLASWEAFQKGRKEGKKRREKKDKRTKNRGMVGKKREIESKKKDDFAVTILGSFFKSVMGRLSKSMKQYIINYE